MTHAMTSKASKQCLFPKTEMAENSTDNDEFSYDNSDCMSANIQSFPTFVRPPFLNK